MGNEDFATLTLNDFFDDQDIYCNFVGEIDIETLVGNEDFTTVTLNELSMPQVLSLL